MIRKLLRTTALAAVAFGLLTNPAIAQPPGAEMMEMHHGMAPPTPEMAKAMAEHRAQMAKDMHVILRLRPDQEGAWQTFEAAMAPPPMSDREHQTDTPVTTPEHLDIMHQHMEVMRSHHAKMETAIRTFYATLSPDQQQVFDALGRMREGHRMHEHGMHGHGGPPMAFGPPPHP